MENNGWSTPQSQLRSSSPTTAHTSAQSDDTDVCATDKHTEQADKTASVSHTNKEFSPLVPARVVLQRRTGRPQHHTSADNPLIQTQLAFSCKKSSGKSHLEASANSGPVREYSTLGTSGHCSQGLTNLNSIGADWEQLTPSRRHHPPLDIHARFDEGSKDSTGHRTQNDLPSFACQATMPPPILEPVDHSDLYPYRHSRGYGGSRPPSSSSAMLGSGSCQSPFGLLAGQCGQQVTYRSSPEERNSGRFLLTDNNIQDLRDPQFAYDQNRLPTWHSQLYHEDSSARMPTPFAEPFNRAASPLKPWTRDLSSHGERNTRPSTSQGISSAGPFRRRHNPAATSYLGSAVGLSSPNDTQWWPTTLQETRASQRTAVPLSSYTFNAQQGTESNRRGPRSRLVAVHKARKRLELPLFANATRPQHCTRASHPGDNSEPAVTTERNEQTSSSRYGLKRLPQDVEVEIQETKTLEGKTKRRLTLFKPSALSQDR